MTLIIIKEKQQQIQILTSIQFIMTIILLHNGLDTFFKLRAKIKAHRKMNIMGPVFSEYKLV